MDVPPIVMPKGFFFLIEFVYFFCPSQPGMFHAHDFSGEADVALTTVIVTALNFIRLFRQQTLSTFHKPHPPASLKLTKMSI